MDYIITKSLEEAKEAKRNEVSEDKFILVDFGKLEKKQSMYDDPTRYGYDFFSNTHCLFNNESLIVCSDDLDHLIRRYDKNNLFPEKTSKIREKYEKYVNV